MVETLDLGNRFRLSIKSLDYGLDPGVTHAGVQALCGSIARLSNLEHTSFAFFQPPHRSVPPGTAARPGFVEPTLYAGLQFEAPLDKFRVVLRCVGDWLNRTAQKTHFAVDIPPAHTITLQTDQAKVLAQLLPLGEALLPPHYLYLSQAERYVSTFGELTPAAQANLNLIRQRMGLPTEDANDLNAQAMGPFKTLAEKYQHFRKELLVCKQETALDDEFWQVMRTKAVTMNLPEADTQFLKAERLSTLRSEAEQVRQQAEAEAEAERQRQRQQQQRLDSYRQSFEELVFAEPVFDALPSQGTEQEIEQFRQSVMAHLSDSEFIRGRLTQARETYNLNPQEADTLEKAVLDELYLLSDLL